MNVTYHNGQPDKVSSSPHRVTALVVISCSAGNMLPQSWVGLIFCSPVSVLTMWHYCEDKTLGRYSESDRASFVLGRKIFWFIIPKWIWFMYCRKTLLIDPIATGGLKWHLIQCSLIGCHRKPVNSWSGLVNEIQKRRKGGRDGELHRAIRLPATLIFVETRSVVLFFNVQRNPHKYSWNERLDVKIQSLIWNVWPLWSSLSFLPFSKIWDRRQKDSHSRTVLYAGTSAELSCSRVHHLPAADTCNFQLLRSSQITPICVMIQYWKQTSTRSLNSFHLWHKPGWKSQIPAGRYKGQPFFCSSIVCLQITPWESIFSSCIASVPSCSPRTSSI